MADWGIVRLSGCITAGPKSVSVGSGWPLACATVLQPVPNCQSAATSKVVQCPFNSSSVVASF